MKQKEPLSPEQAMKLAQKIFKKRGTEALQIARKEILREKIDCKEAREALNFFMTKYWHDTTRPSLFSLACEAVGGKPEATTPIAVSMILTSGALDIHDDLIDQSKTKGSHQTVLGKFGKDIALLAGDALMFKGLMLLNYALEKGVSTEKKATIMDVFKRRFFELGDAEAIELNFRGRADVTPKEYLRVVKKKAADFEAYTRIGAILGGGTREEIEALGKYGRILGMLIILRDDLIDMIDLQESIQRIRKESLPLPVLYALQNAKLKGIIVSLLLQKKNTKDHAKTIVEHVERAGGIKRTQRLMQTLINGTISSLTHIKFNKKYLELLLHAMIPSMP